MISSVISRRNSSIMGFTLIELLVVISIIGLLSSIVMSSLNTARAKARDAARLSEIRQIRLALQMYQDSNGGNPLNNGGAWTCLGLNDGVKCFNNTQSGSTVINNALSPYIPQIPKDPLNNPNKWGDAYLYNSNFTDTTSYVSQGFIFSNTPILHWGYEGCTQSQSVCGGGAYGSWGSATGNGCGNFCVLPVL